MPNWCYNSLYITGPEHSVTSFVEKAKLRSIEDKFVPLSFHNLYPEPNYEEVSVFPAIQDTPVGNSSTMPDWWNWRVANWGTKWDLDSYTNFDSGVGWATYNFDTAWSPPIELFDKVSNDYPTLKFSLTYGEPGMWFSGQAIWEDGQMFSHTEGEYQSFFPDEAKEMLSEIEE